MIHNQITHGCIVRASNPFKIMIKNKIHMYLNFADLKIQIFLDFRIFVFRPKPKSENSEITKSHRKTQNTEISESNFKNF